jgi:hypothetical protein
VVHSEDAGERGRAGRRRAQAKRPAPGTVELFNLNDDPYEEHNLASEQPGKVKELERVLEHFAEEAVPPKAGPQPKDYKAPKVWGEFGG